jgi:hypothetical protein
MGCFNASFACKVIRGAMGSLFQVETDVNRAIQVGILNNTLRRIGHPRQTDL